MNTLQYVDASTSTRMSCYSPEDNSLITDNVHKAVEKDVNAAVIAARAAFKKWTHTPPSVRASILLKFANLIEVHADQIALLEAVCAGKPLQVFHRFEKILTTSVYRCK